MFEEKTENSMLDDLRAGIVVLIVMGISLVLVGASYLRHPKEIWELLTKQGR